MDAEDITEAQLRETIAAVGDEARATGGDELFGAVLEGRYELLEPLGAGGMGVVYLARHLVLGHEVAIKVLRRTSEQADVQLERLRREAVAASAIGNPHIVDVKDFGSADGRTYVVMELIRGRQLFALVRQEPLAWERAARICEQLCDALGDAHAHGIIHRDLKPENVLLIEREREPDFVKVLDFGIAKLLDADKKLTAAGQLVGTPEYMSPEQCLGEGIDARSDIYALGILLYEMVTGTVPFSDERPMETCYAHLTEPPPPPSVWQPGLPEALERVILRCLEKEPSARFPDTDALRAALAAVRHGEAPEPEVAGQTPAADGPTQKEPEVVVELAPRGTGSQAPAPRRGWGFAIAAAALVAAGFATAAGVAPGEPPSARARGDLDKSAMSKMFVRAPEAPAEAAASLESRAMPIHLRSAPVEAEVWLDGERVGRTPWRVPALGPDEVLRAELRAPGYRSREVSLSARTREDATVTLTRRPRRAPSQMTAAEPRAQTEQTPLEPPPGVVDHSGFLDPWRASAEAP